MSPFQRAALILLAGLSLLLLAASSRAASAHPVQALASRVLPGVTVACKPLDDVTGQTYQTTDANGRSYFERYIELSRPTCSALAKLAAHQVTNRRASANALETLLHEAHHITLNTGNEGRAECAALLSMRFWLNRLGYHAAAATRLLRLAWEEHEKLPSNYLGSCRAPWSFAVLVGITEPVRPVAR